jgi:hypothetical protein
LNSMATSRAIGFGSSFLSVNLVSPSPFGGLAREVLLSRNSCVRQRMAL